MTDGAPRSPLSADRRKELCAAWSKIESPEALIKEVFQTLGEGVAIGTSGQLSGVTLIHMASQAGVPFRVFCVDTLRLHTSTYELWERLEDHYNLKLEIHRPDDGEVDRMVRQHGEHLFFDNRSKQEHCCNIRKVNPHREALKNMVAWVSGLRRDQSTERSDTPRCSEADYEGRTLLKISPLVDWSEEDVWAYVRDNNVPYDPLFDPRPDGGRYPSVGCIICTTAVLPHEAPRAGRWRWFNEGESDHKKECGIHLDGTGE